MADTKYDESFPERAMDFAAVGLTDRQIAHKMDISRSSFYSYKQQHPEFAEAIEWGRELVDSRVENSLLHLAMGDYTITTNVTTNTTTFSSGTTTQTITGIPENLATTPGEATPGTLSEGAGARCADCAGPGE